MSEHTKWLVIRHEYFLFVNNKNIVIADNTGFTMKQIKRIRSNRTKQGQTRERFLYNYITGIISRDLEMLGRYERQIMVLDEEVSADDFQKYKEQSAALIIADKSDC